MKNPLNHPRLTPLLILECVKETDTYQMIDKAFKIADEHPYYLGQSMGGKARFASYATEEDKISIGKSAICIRVDPNSVYNTFRFQAALKKVRATA